MFHWLKVDWRRHPLAATKAVEEIEEELFLKSIEHGALVLRGSWFYAQRDVPHETLFFRVTYAAAPFEKIEEAIRRFGVAVRESFGLVEEASGRETNGVW
jgi:aromatic amino acid aminotransferase I